MSILIIDVDIVNYTLLFRAEWALADVFVVFIDAVFLDNEFCNKWIFMYNFIIDVDNVSCALPSVQSGRQLTAVTTISCSSIGANFFDLCSKS